MTSSHRTHIAHRIDTHFEWDRKDGVVYVPLSPTLTICSHTTHKTKMMNIYSTESNQTTSPIIPGKYDILCGRGSEPFLHEGNKRFRVVIASYVTPYQAADRKGKTAIARTIIRGIEEAGGRFLKRTGTTGPWFDTDKKAAREKVGHSLRDASSNKTKCITEVREHVQSIEKNSEIEESHPTTKTGIKGRLHLHKRNGIESTICTSPVDCGNVKFGAMLDRFCDPSSLLWKEP